MLATYIQLTAPAKDTSTINKSLIQIAQDDLIFFEPESNYPFINLARRIANLNSPTIIEVPDSIISLSPLDKVSSITKFISGRLLNNTADTIVVTTHATKLIAIQEAKNGSGIWQPIEYWFNDRCGNSFGEFSLAPNEFVSFYIPRYCGAFKTSIRLKIFLGSNIVASREWTGRIDKKQFIKPKEASDKSLKMFYSFLEQQKK